jgi:hypothetical protein
LVCAAAFGGGFFLILLFKRLSTMLRALFLYTIKTAALRAAALTIF